MTSPLPAEEGGRGEALHPEYGPCDNLGTAGSCEYCQDMAYRAASVVGDASEGEAAEIERALNAVDEYAHGKRTIITMSALKLVAASLRSTRAALEEAREDTKRLNWLEATAKRDEHVELNYCDAWSESGDYGSVLSSGPAEFWLSDNGYENGPTLRDAIDGAMAWEGPEHHIDDVTATDPSAIPSQESTKV